MFQKKMLVMAVAGAFSTGVAGAAFAQAPSGDDAPVQREKVGNVEVYGFLYPEFTVLSSGGATVGGASSSTLGSAPSATGATLKSRNSVDASNSRLGFRGTEDLGSGLRALWQIESTVPIDTGDTGGILATRDSFVGLGGGFGTVRLGNMETVYKTLGDPLKFMNISSGNFVSASNIISSRQPFNASGAASSAGSFHLRRTNSLLYNSPEFGGVQLHAMYSPDEIRTGNLNADLQSYGATYKRGGLFLALAYEVHNDLFAGSLNVPAAIANPTTGAGSVHSKDKSTRGSAMYSWGNTRVALDLATVEFTESGGATGKFQNYKNTRYNLAWEQNWGGPWRTLVQYSSASAGSCSLVGDVTCTTNGLQGNMLAMGGEYWFSKRTALFALYAKLNNGSAATYNNSANAKTLSPGDDITQYALGIRTTF
jgi:predicted porin